MTNPTIETLSRCAAAVDITYDIRAIAPELCPPPPDRERLPANPTRRGNGRKRFASVERLEAWVHDEVVPLQAKRLRREGLSARVAGDRDVALIEYEALSHGSGYVRPAVVLEFGARSTGEPAEQKSVTCDAAGYLSELLFPEATPAVMRPERTFWEKATAIHVYCRGGRFRGAERFSRHWYDLDCLSRTAYFEPAVTDRELAQRVADHKQVFFRERDEGGDVVDYWVAVRGRLRLGPSGELERFLLTITTECWLTALFSKPPRISKRSSRVAARSRNAPIGNGSRA